MKNNDIDQVVNLLSEYAKLELAGEQCRRELLAAGVDQNQAFWMWVSQAIAEKQKQVALAIAVYVPSRTFRHFGEKKGR